MNSVHVILTIDLANLPENFPEIVKHEQAQLVKWKEEGILSHFFLTQTKDAAYLIFKDIDTEKTKELVESLPLYPLKKSVEYTELIQQF